jgi:hypothetical protein
MNQDSLKSLKMLTAGAFLAAYGIGSPSVQAQDRFIDQVRNQLNQAAKVFVNRGYERTHDFKLDRLPQGRADTLSVTLRQGFEYVLLGVCDNDCTDLDIKIFDENNNLVAEDSSTDDVPIVTVTPRRTARFRISINMFKCSDNPCYYGVGVFGK